ncbi:hypothetical protein E4K10_40920 [Streptomyces sp. T1317-0309]|nr:hypothetical protein E4K10_40920 [Streptomyces sp. T1317-0309]
MSGGPAPRCGRDGPHVRRRTPPRSRTRSSSANPLAHHRDRRHRIRPADSAGTRRRPPIRGHPSGRARRARRRAARGLSEALSWWRGEPYADLDASPWLTPERARLAELHREAVGRGPSDARPRTRRATRPGTGGVRHHTPVREHAWLLLAHALYQAGRQVDALASLRDARARLLDRFGLESADSLDRLERDILRHAPHLTPAPRDETGCVCSPARKRRDLHPAAFHEHRRPGRGGHRRYQPGPCPRATRRGGGGSGTDRRPRPHCPRDRGVRRPHHLDALR